MDTILEGFFKGAPVNVQDMPYFKDFGYSYNGSYFQDQAQWEEYQRRMREQQQNYADSWNAFAKSKGISPTMNPWDYFGGQLGQQYHTTGGKIPTPQTQNPVTPFANVMQPKPQPQQPTPTPTPTNVNSYTFGGNKSAYAQTPNTLQGGMTQPQTSNPYSVNLNVSGRQTTNNGPQQTFVNRALNGWNV